MIDMRSKGTTILYVSYSIESVKSVCDNVLWLNNGNVMDVGSGDSIVKEYIRFINGGA